MITACDGCGKRDVCKYLYESKKLKEEIEKFVCRLDIPSVMSVRLHCNQRIERHRVSDDE